MRGFNCQFGLRPLSRKWFWAVFSLITAVMLLGSPRGMASEVVCSVCGKSFPGDTEKCPNDGTDLKKLGIKIEEDPVSAEEKAEEPAPDSPVEEAPRPKENADQQAKPIYKRGGRRRVIKPSGSAYSDRNSRISRRRGRTVAQEDEEGEDEELVRFIAENDKRLAHYETQRRQAEALRQRMELVERKARKNRRAANKRLLYGLGAPLTSLGFRMFWMGERNDPGAVNAIEIDLNLARYRLRAGLSTLIGVRSLTGRNELVFLEHVSLGFQWPWRYSPFVIIRGGVGVLASERFGVSFVNLITSIGAEIGIDSWVTPWIAITPSVGYARTILDNAYWNSVTFKVAVGF